MTGSTRLVYLVSRFPLTSETFIARELAAVAASTDAEIQLRSLFPAGDQVVHNVAQSWVDRLVRPGLPNTAAGVLWAAVIHPTRLARVMATVIRDYRKSPRLLVRALATVGLACAHARDLVHAGGRTHIHAHYATYPALAAWVCRQLVGVTYSFTAHAHDIYVDQSMLRRKVIDAAFVVTISDFNKDLLEQFADGATPISVIHSGIDSSSYAFRARSIPSEGRVRALTVASLQTYKGHAILIRALAMGGPLVSRIAVEFIGDGILRTELERLASAEGIADRVRFSGARTEQEVRKALDEADLFILPSVMAPDGQMEGLPVALMEALACGVPTVSTDLSGIPEIVIDGETGYLAEPDDAEDLSRVLERAVDDYPATMSLAGRELVESRFDLGSTSADLVSLLQEQLDT